MYVQYVKKNLKVAILEVAVFLRCYSVVKFYFILLECLLIEAYVPNTLIRAVTKPNTVESLFPLQ
jgi:hypothetical protein